MIFFLVLQNILMLIKINYYYNIEKQHFVTLIF